MAFKQFPKQQYFRIINTDIVTRIGYFNLKDGTELKEMMITLFVKGIIAAPFNIRMNIYGNDDQAEPIFSSDWAELSAATLLNNDTDPGTAYTNNWLGTIYFDFPGYPLNPNINYFMSIETDGYTRNGDTFYIGINLDWYSEVNNQLDGPAQAGARIRPLGIRP